jgi:hypothetical protein
MFAREPLVFLTIRHVVVPADLGLDAGTGRDPTGHLALTGSLISMSRSKRPYHRAHMSVFPHARTGLHEGGRPIETDVSQKPDHFHLKPNPF